MLRTTPDIGALPIAEPPAAHALHLQSLTGLRIIAALAVYLSHLPPPGGAPEWVRRGLGAGYYGVTVFFVLSGFVLALNYWDDLAAPTARRLWAYTVARFARIYPLYLLVIAYLVFRGRVVGGEVSPTWPLHLAGVQAWHTDLFVAFEFGPAWSISVEFFLYASMPLIVPLLRPVDRSIARLVAVTVMTVAAMLALAWWFQAAGRADLLGADPTSAHRWLYRTPVTRLGDFVLGVLAARIYMRVRHTGAGGWMATAGMVTIGVLACTAAPVGQAYRWDVAYAVPATALILGLALTPGAVVGRALGTTPAVFLGEASYAFYLVHLFAAKSFGAGAWKDGVTLATTGLELFALGATLALASGLYVTVERPARTRLRRALTPRSLRPARQ
jgi:peptidoglycan/LPS O-acetylase OafA/YrhL